MWQRGHGDYRCLDALPDAGIKWLAARGFWRTLVPDAREDTWTLAKGEGRHG